MTIIMLEKQTKKCLFCGKEFEDESGNHPNKKYCSVKCSSAAHHKLTYKPSIRETENRECKFCGKQFSVGKKMLQKVYCSVACREKYRLLDKKLPLKIKNCLYCEKEFTTPRGSQKFCSNQCRDNFISSNKYPKNNKECLYCGNIFLAKQKNSKYCSSLCRHKDWKENLNSSLYKESSKKYRESQNGKYISYRNGALTRGISFNLSFDEFITFWNKPCTYCGKEISGVGIDRINNSQSYNIKNCTSCCSFCNTIKLNHSLSDFFSHIKQIYKHSKLNKYCPSEILGPIKE